MSFTCRYCQKDFVRETSLEKHSCEQKRRFLDKDSVASRFGFQSYLKFYELTQGAPSTRDFTDFSKSPYYKAFYKFGKYCSETKVLNFPNYLVWLLKNQKKIDKWASDSFYTEYLKEYLLIENVNDAVSRAINFAIEWGEENNAPDKDCLRFGNQNRLLYAISTGKISPWVLYNCESGQKFLASITSEQVSLIWPYIDSDKWNQKFIRDADDTLFVKEILKKAGW